MKVHVLILFLSFALVFPFAYADESLSVETDMVHVNSEDPNESNQIYMRHKLLNEFHEPISVQVSNFYGIESSLVLDTCKVQNVMPTQVLIISYDSISLNNASTYIMLPAKIEYGEQNSSFDQEITTNSYAMIIKDSDTNLVTRTSVNFSCDNIQVLDSNDVLTLNAPSGYFSEATLGFNEDLFGNESEQSQQQQNQGQQQSTQPQTDQLRQQTQEMIENFMQQNNPNLQRPDFMEQNTEQIRDEILNDASRNEQIFSELQQNSEFQNYDEQLSNQGLAQQQPQFLENSEGDVDVTVPYENEEEESSIMADYVDGEITNVRIPEVIEEETTPEFLWLIATLVGAGIIFALLRKKLPKKEKITDTPLVQVVGSTTSFVDTARQMLNDAKKLHEKKKIKDSYEVFAQSIRYYYSYKLDLKKEMTTFEVLREIKKHSLDEFNQVQECLSLCGMIEFAKHQESENDFEKATKIFSRLLI